jgi:hypothetical protein
MSCARKSEREAALTPEDLGTTAIEAVWDSIHPGVDRLDVSQNLYDRLVEECEPKTPSEYFGIPIGVIPGEGAGLVH